MNTRTTLSISEARKKIFDIAEAVQKPDTYYTLTEKGRPKVVLMSAEEFESWVETLEVMHEFPDLKADIEKVDHDVASGKYKRYATLEEVMADYGYVFADQSKIHYALRRSVRKKRPKRTRKIA